MDPRIDAHRFAIGPRDGRDLWVLVTHCLEQRVGSAPQAAPAGVLEINAHHALIRGLSKLAMNPATRGKLEDLGRLLLDQARIREGELPTDIAAFAKRMAEVMTDAVTAKA